jgi:acyl-CoA hydrolase
MSSTTRNHPARNISAAEAAALVQSGDWVEYGTSLCQPDVFDQALAERKSELQNINIRACLSVRARAVLEADPQREVFNWYNWHFSGYDRKKADLGQANYIPCNLGEISDYYRRFIAPSAIAVIKVCPIDANGFFNFSAANLWHSAILERAKIVIVEVCEGLPYVHGVNNGVHISQVDYIIQGDSRPAPELPNPAATDVDRTVAQLIAAEIEDGACLQVGIGGMPNAVCSMLLHSGVRNLGVHTEMLTDGIIDLYQAGIITGAAKQLDVGKIVCSFGLGSQALYTAINRNPDILCNAVETTNLPHTIMQNHNVVGINNTTQMDLQGQAASEADGHRHISGSGGQLQFVRGAYASPGGKAFMCLASTYERKGVRKSRIVLDMPPGTIVTTPRSDMMYVVTEFGMVNLKGKSIPERAQAMISIAHPDFREGLEREARENGLIPKGFV